MFLSFTAEVINLYVWQTLCSGRMVCLRKFKMKDWNPHFCWDFTLDFLRPVLNMGLARMFIAFSSLAVRTCTLIPLFYWATEVDCSPLTLNSIFRLNHITNHAFSPPEMVIALYTAIVMVTVHLISCMLLLYGSIMVSNSMSCSTYTAQF